MPLYEFECQTCHNRFERIQSVKEPDPNCPKCGGAVERLLHAPAVQFKGSGWYVTDYAKKPAGASASGSESEKSESAAKTEASADGKEAKDKKLKAETSAKKSEKR